MFLIYSINPNITLIFMREVIFRELSDFLHHCRRSRSVPLRYQAIILSPAVPSRRQTTSASRRTHKNPASWNPCRHSRYCPDTVLRRHYCHDGLVREHRPIVPEAGSWPNHGRKHRDYHHRTALSLQH